MTARPSLRLRLISAQQIRTKTELELSMLDYLTAARQSGLTPKTLQQYRWQLERLGLWLVERNATEPGDLSRALLREWGASLWEKWQAATVKQAISAARAWLGWLYAEHLMADDLRDVLKVPKVKKRIQRTLTTEEIEKLLAGCDDRPAGLRNAALVSLLVDSGLRSAEVCRLRLADLNLELGVLKVVVKGGNEEPGYFGPPTSARLRAWLRVRAAAPGVDVVFVAIGGTRPGFPLTVAGLHRIVSNLGKRVGVRGVSTHSFRRAFACLLTEAGASNRLIQEWGRWEDEKMVRQYTAGLNAARLYQSYSPTQFMGKLLTGD